MFDQNSRADYAHQPPPPQPAARARPTPVVTYTLIALNALVFVAMVLSGISLTNPTAEQVFAWGANYGPATMHGQWWRLLTACFLHFGIIHIALNMYVFYQVGPFTELLYGRAKYLALYILAGLGGSLLSLIIHPDIVSAGASGAIFGVYGGLLAFVAVRRSVFSKQGAQQLVKSSLIFIGINLVYGFSNPEIDLSGHIGGIITGFLVGCILARNPS